MRTLSVVLLGLLAVGCVSTPVTLHEPLIKHQGDVAAYSFVLIEQRTNMKETNAVATSAAAVASAREFDPAQLIEGILLKKGLVRVETVTDSRAARTLIVKWGASGKRDIQLGDPLSGYRMAYTQEVTLSLVNTVTFAPVFTCTAEGIGVTEIDDIREAIIRCLSGL